MCTAYSNTPSEHHCLKSFKQKWQKIETWYVLHCKVISWPRVSHTTGHHNIHLLLDRLCDHPVLYSHRKPCVIIIYQVLPSGHVTMYRMLNAQLFLQPQLYLTQNICYTIRTIHNCVFWLDMLLTESTFNHRNVKRCLTMATSVSHSY
jgi:hypothetical protein